MSQAEELLKGLSVAADVPTVSIEPINDILLIDPETRTINVPSSELLFGVTGDRNVERKHFKCPKIVGDNIDLSKLSIRIPYQCSSGYEDIYPVSDLKVVGDYITFSWKLNANVFTDSGSVFFAICAVKTDSEGNETNEWNTVAASGNISQGLHVASLSPDEEFQARDVLQQLLNMLNTKSEEAVRNVESATAEQIAAVEEKGAEVLASIPEDYTTTYETAEEAVRTKADAIVLKTAGEVITVDDSSDDYVRGLKIFGKSTQITTTGKNLLDTSADNAISLSGYENFRCTDGIIEITNVALFGFKMPAEYGVNYAISLNKIVVDGVFHFRVYEYSDVPTTIDPGAEPNYIARPVSESCASQARVEYIYTPTAENVTWIAIGFYTDTTNTLANLQVEIGDAVTKYEPYTGGKAAPNPEYPQEIVSIGHKSRNMFPNNAESKTVTGVHFEIDKYGRVIANGTASSTEYIDINRNGENLEAGEYIVNGCPVGGSATTYRMYVYKNVNGENILIGSIFDGSLKFTLDVSCNVWIRTAIESGVTVKDLMFEPMIYKSSEKVIEFEPYTNKYLVGVKDIGKNYLKVTAVSQTVDGVTFTVNEDGSVIANGTATANIYFAIGKFNLRSGNYKISGCMGGSTSTYLLYFQKTDGTGYIHTTDGEKTFTITNDDDERKVLIAVYKGTTVSNVVFYPMISSEGEVFEPYKGMMEWLFLDEPLRAIPVNSNGNYIDSDGQQWVGDYVDLERGSLIQRIGSYTVTGSEDWYLSGVQNLASEGIYRYDANYISKNSSGTSNTMSTHYPYPTRINLEKGCWVLNDATQHLALRIMWKYATVDELKTALGEQYIQNTPVVINYILAEPIITPLTTEEIEAFKTLRTNYPHTTVLNTENTFMELKYNADTELYIEQNFVPKSVYAELVARVEAIEAKM